MLGNVLGGLGVAAALFLVVSCDDDGGGGGGGGTTTSTSSTSGTGGTGGVGVGGADGGMGGSAGSGGGTGGQAGGGGTNCGQPATLVPVTGGHGIDATEVTRCQYAAWLDTNPPDTGQLAECSWNTGAAAFEPTCAWPPGDKGDHPVVCVDWCDAYAYCSAVGKRLCGKIGGGSLSSAENLDATKSQWFNACTSGGVHNFPYGGDPQIGMTDGYDGQKCNGADKGVGTTLPVATCAECVSTVSGYTGVYDLSGNVSEWQDSCSSDSCWIRGGDYLGYAISHRCHVGGTLDRNVNNAHTVGFRCCSSP